MPPYLMSPPSPQWAPVARAPASGTVNGVQARKEWDVLVELMMGRGAQIHCLSADDAPAGLPFAAQAGLPLPGQRFLLPKMRSLQRRGEAALWGAFMQTLGYTTVAAPSDVFEGQADVTTFAGRSLIFYGGRTSRHGAEAVAQQVPDPLLLEIREPASHGHLALLTLASADRLVLCPDVFSATSLATLEATFRSERFLRLSLDELRAYTTSSLIVGDTLIASHLLPERMRAAFAKLGYRVETPPLVELCEKVGGAPRSFVCELPAF